MRVRKIDHVNIRTDLIEQSCAFYETLLKLKRTSPGEMDPKRIAWLCDSDGNPIVHLNAPPEDEAPGRLDDTGRIHHIAFDCTGHAEFVATLDTMGVGYETNYFAPVDLHQIFVIDPNGIRLELNFMGANHK